MKIRGSTWFTGGAMTIPFNIGVVVYDSEQGALRATIGTVKGINPEEDIKVIVDGGAKIDIAAAIILLDKQGGWNIPLTEEERQIIQA